MPTFAEIANALQGSVMLARRDTGGYSHFDISAESFWRSFLVIFLVAPLYLAVSSLGAESATDVAATDAEAPSMLVRMVVLTAEWLANTAAMALVTRLLGLQHNYVPYIIVYNWTSVLAIAAVTPPFLLNAFGLIDTQMTIYLFVALSFGVMYYRWFIARTALDTSGMTAAGIVAFDMVFSMFVGMGVKQLLTVPAMI
jgi:hypothetical protein